MTLENISNVPEVCSGMLRIALRALHIPKFLRGGPQTPLRSFPQDSVGIAVAHYAT